MAAFSPFMPNPVGFDPTASMTPGATPGLPSLGGMSSLASSRCCGPGLAMQSGSAQMLQAEMTLMQLTSMLMGMLMGLMMGMGRTATGDAAGNSSVADPISGTGSVPGTTSGGGAGTDAGSGTSGTTSSAPVTDVSSLPATGSLAQDIANDARAHVNNERGLCLKNAGAVLRRHGIKCGPAPAAYMVADDLARSPKMREIRVSKDQLEKLPPGSVIVWDKGSGLPYGHISISLGNGKEFSGPVRNQMHLSTSYRVFVPVEKG